MEKKLIILVALFVICFAGSALAAEVQWFGSANPGDPQDRSWINPANWRYATVPPGYPTRADRVKINGVWGNLGPIISTDLSDWGVGEIFISEGPPDLAPQSLTVGVGGDVTTGSDGGIPYLGQVNIGYASHNTGTLIMDGGTMNITQHLWLGWGGKGILQMNSGTLNTNAMLGIGWGGATGSAEIHLDGGLLHSAQWWGGTSWLETHNYTFDFGGDGTWEIHGYWIDEITMLVDNGWITAQGGLGTVDVAWDEARGLTVVTPEPITLSLLGLGALLLRRRS